MSASNNPNATGPQISIAKFGAVGDGHTVNTSKIQSAIDHLAERERGTIVIPAGVFLSGAIFIKPGVNLHLDQGAVLKGSTEKKDYPKMQTRIEGHFEDWLPALINADKTDHLRITGEGTLDGNGAAFWEEFWTRHRENPQVTNLAVERPRLALIQNSKDVRLSGITFKDSGFWNLHLYRCNDVRVENIRFEISNNAHAPSTDGTDIDSCQNVTIHGCHYSVDDDCICLKGSKGPMALEDKNSPPIEHIRVTECTFARGHGVVTLGSEATIVRDVVVENCRVLGPIDLVRLKLRPDTPQRFEDIHYRGITLQGEGTIFAIKPWTQFFELKGMEPPQSIVRNISLSELKGDFSAFGNIEGNPGQTAISNISIADINVQLKHEKLRVVQVTDLKTENNRVNGKPIELIP
ncbi:MAG: glycoside hydrolase family 28 protein [Chthoniobacteraceae bacterium]